jgi:hypothetical protein
MSITEETRAKVVTKTHHRGGTKKMLNTRMKVTPDFGKVLNGKNATWGILSKK